MGDRTCLHAEGKISMESTKLILGRDGKILGALSLSREEGMQVEGWTLWGQLCPCVKTSELEVLPHQRYLGILQPFTYYWNSLTILEGC